jgi:hypothetical protein
MDLTVNYTTARGRPAQSTAGTRTRAVGWQPAAVVTLGTLLSLFGVSWDVQWHTDVGPDTFFTLPHLVIYSGSAIAGIASLAVVLRTTAAQRAGREVNPHVGGTPVRVFGGTFTAPLGYLVSGGGAAMFLLMGLWDMWWHTLYGFDAVLNSPPHVALFLTVSITMVGTVLTFAAARDQPWGRTGIALSAPVLIAFSGLTVQAFKALPGGVVDPIAVGTAFLAVMLIIMVAACLRRPMATLPIGVVLAAIQGVLWVFSPWATHVYAASVGLPMRDAPSPIPAFPAKLPMFLVIAAAVVDLTLWLAHRNNWSVRWVPLVAGSAAGLALAALSPLQDLIMTGHAQAGATTVLADAIGGGVLGVLSGFLGWRFGTMARGNGATRPAPVLPDAAEVA